jgi:hypothetical protein
MPFGGGISIIIPTASIRPDSPAMCARRMLFVRITGSWMQDELLDRGDGLKKKWTIAEGRSETNGSA